MSRSASRNRHSVKRRNPYRPRDYDTSLGSVEPSGLRSRLSEMPASLGSQFFGLVPAISGAAALFILSFKLSGARKMSTAEVIMASAIAAVGALSGIFFIRTFR